MPRHHQHKESPDRDLSRLRVVCPICVALVIAVLAVYWPVNEYEFVHFDDYQYVADNAHVRSGLSPVGIRWAATSSHASNWHPVAWWSHMLDVSLFGLDAGRHHMASLFWHILNCLMLFFLIRRMNGPVWTAGFIAALFALHPMNVESVVWISQRKTLLCALFWILTLWAYIRYAEQPRFTRYLAVLALFALSLMSKPMAVTLPFVLLLLDVWPLGRLQLKKTDDFTAANPAPASVKYLLIEKIPLLVLSAVSSTATYLIQSNSGAVGSFDRYPLTMRIGNVLISYIRYVIKAIDPGPMVIIYPFHPIPGWLAAGALLLLCGASLVALRTVRRHPYITVGWFWYLGTLVPVVGLVQVGPQAMADRYAYLPYIGLFCVIAWGGAWIAGQWRLRKRIVAIGAVGFLLILSMVSRYQVTVWKDSTTLFQHAVQETSGNYIAHHNLALELAAKNRTEEAVFHFNRALAIHASFPIAHNNLGSVLLKNGRLDEAVYHFGEAIRLKPKFTGALYNMGNALAAAGKYDSAIDWYSRALATSQDDADIHNNLGNVLLRQERRVAARSHYEKAIMSEPSSKPALLNLAKLNIIEGDYETARSLLKRVLDLTPHDPEPSYVMAATYAKQDRVTEAVTWLKRSIHNGFNNREYLNSDENMANLRSTAEYEKLMIELKP